MIALLGCQNVDDTTAPAGATAQDGAPRFPDLNTVPARPQLSYTIEQHRASADGLVADRENARYTSQVVRYRAGLSTASPPARPPVVAGASGAVSGETAPRGAGAVPTERRPGLDPETEVIYDDDDLNTFMEEMLQRSTPAEAPGPEANARREISLIAEQMAAPVRTGRSTRPNGVAIAMPTERVRTPERATQVAVADARRSELPTPVPRPIVGQTPVPRPAPARHGTSVVAAPATEPVAAGIDVAGGLIALDADAAGSAAPRSAELEPEPVGIIAFGDGSAQIGPNAAAAIEEVLAAAKGQPGIRLIAEGPSPELALGRARAVGLALVRAGYAADRVAIAPVGEATNDRVGLFAMSQAMP